MAFYFLPFDSKQMEIVFFLPSWVPHPFLHSAPTARAAGLWLQSSRTDIFDTTLQRRLRTRP
jgi:hypothetical protein